MKRWSLRGCLLGVALGTLTGCGEPTTVRVYAERDATLVLEEAGALLGLQLARGDGPIILELVDPAPGEPSGRLLARRSCLRVLRASYQPIVVAHELGHAFGLDHVDEPTNIMAPYTDANSIDLQDGQREKLLDAARRLSRCR